MQNEMVRMEDCFKGGEVQVLECSLGARAVGSESSLSVRVVRVECSMGARAVDLECYSSVRAMCVECSLTARVEDRVRHAITP